MRLAMAATMGLLALAAPAAAQLASVETGPLRLVFFEGTESYLVPHAARTFLNSLQFQRSLFRYTPEDPITVLLADFSDYGNAGASSVPRNTLQVQIAPLSFAFETITANEAMNTIMNHELVHVAAMDGAAGRDRALRRLLAGKVNPIADQPESMLYFYLTSPRVAAPRWYHEGLAVFVDTWMSGGIGRAQGGYDEMVFRSMVKDGAHFYDPLGLVSQGTKVDFQLQINAYLYGTRFMTWLAHEYSPEHVIAWTARRPGSRAYYATQFRHVFGLSLSEAWTRWIAFEQAFQRQNLETIRQHPLTPYVDLTPRALGSVSRAFFDPGTRRLYAAFNYPGVVAHIGALDVTTGDVQRFVDVKGPLIYQVTSLAYDPRSRTIFYTTDNGAHRDLLSLDIQTGTTRLLQKDARIGDLAFNRADGTLWGVRHLNGLCSLVRMNAPYRQWTRVVSFPYGTVAYDLDLSPDGTKLSASVGEISGQQRVNVFAVTDLAEGRVDPVATFAFGPSVPSGFVFSSDGRYLYGSSYYAGASNVFRYDLLTSELDAVTNAETGFFRPVPLDGDELIAFRYAGEGFIPARLTARPIDDVSAITFLGERTVAKHPALKDWIAGSPAQIPYDTMPKTTGKYRSGKGLRVESWYPVVQGYRGSAAAGVRVNLSDPLQLNRASLTVSSSPGSAGGRAERFHARAEYQRYDWTGHVALNDASFYDLFGPTQSSRKGYSVGIGRTTTLVYDEPRRISLDVGARLAGHLDQLPAAQRVAVSVDRLASIEAALRYSNVQASLGGVDEEQGRRWSAIYEADYPGAALFSRVHGTFDSGFPLPAGHASLWLRSAAGFSPQPAAEPFANFYFGAFGNNYVDRGDEKRYRRYYSFPGAALNAIEGRNFVKSLLEVNLPPIRFEHAGTEGAYLTWIRPAVFAAGLVTNLDDATRRRRAVTAGIQLDLRFTIVSVLDVTLSAGGAVAASDRGTSREAMISLKVLR